MSAANSYEERTAGEYCGVTSPGEAAAAALATTDERAAAPVHARRAEERICRVPVLPTEPAGSCCPLTLALRHARPRALAEAAGLLAPREELLGPAGFWASGAATQQSAAVAIAAAGVCFPVPG